jgi:hypothetical protein
MGRISSEFVAILFSVQKSGVLEGLTPILLNECQYFDNVPMPLPTLRKGHLLIHVTESEQPNRYAHAGDNTLMASFSFILASYVLFTLNVLSIRSWMPNIQDLVVFTILLGFAFTVSFGSLFVEPVRSRPTKFLIYHLICVGMATVFAILMMMQSPMAVILLLCWPFFGINGIAWLLYVTLERAKVYASASIFVLSIVLLWVSYGPSSSTVDGWMIWRRRELINVSISTIKIITSLIATSPVFSC